MLSMLKARTGLTPNISARFAICLSLKDRSVPNPDEYNEEGSELAEGLSTGLAVADEDKQV